MRKDSVLLSVRGVVVLDGKLLVVRNRDKDGTAQEFTCLPGGAVDQHEGLEDAIHREMVEELGVEPEIGRLLYIHQFIHPRHGEICEFFFEIKNVDDYTNIDLSQTTHGEAELAEVDFIDHSSDQLKPDFLRGVDLADLPNVVRVIRSEG